MTGEIPEPHEPSDAAILAALERAAGGRAAATVIETHAARIVLGATKAWKIKKRVRLPFLDFTTREARRAALARELELNAPHAPMLYHRLVPIAAGPDGTLALDGAGPPVDWALEMTRFDQSCLLAAVMQRDRLAPALCHALGAMVAKAHTEAPAAYRVDAPARVNETLTPLLARLAEAEAIVDPKPLSDAAETAAARLAPLLAARALQGAVRRCHGDLHAENVVVLDGRPVPFDALEFDENLATIDVVYDLAFLLMDISVRGDGRAANMILNAYVGEAPFGNELEGLATLPLFLAMRAAVRAVVALARSRQPGADHARETEHARDLVAAAARFLAPPPPRLITVGGFSGTGKTTLARELAPIVGAAPGALHIRSDVERKRLFNVPETERLSPDHYVEKVSNEVYRLMLNKAARALAAGHSVIVDAVFAKPHERNAFRDLARDAGVAWHGLWLEAPADTLIDRIEARRGDASDANASVVGQQLSYQLGTLDWRRLDSRGEKEGVVARAREALAL